VAHTKKKHKGGAEEEEDGEGKLQLKVSWLYSLNEVHHYYPSYSPQRNLPDNERFYHENTVDRYIPTEVTDVVPVLFLPNLHGAGCPPKPALGSGTYFVNQVGRERRLTLT
jgi:hypothetical protein